jgi:hypothetical protein
MTVDASVVVALTLANKLIGAMGVVARRAADVFGEGNAASGRRSSRSRLGWRPPQCSCAAGRAGVVLRSECKLLIPLVRDRRRFAANSLITL